MSTHTEHSAWSPDEMDSLENIDKEVQLVSTSTESHSASNQIDGNVSGGHTKIISESSLKADAVLRQSNLDSSHSKTYDNLQAIKFHPTSSDVQDQENRFMTSMDSKENSEDSGNHLFTALNTHPTKKSNPHVNDCVHSMVNHNSNNKMAKLKGTPTKKTETTCKQDYLEQINKQLTKELDEKNAILTMLQENYERLLFKYAEAQNRIDELRIKFLADKSESQTFQRAEYPVSNSHIPNFFNEDYSNKGTKCQKAVVTPYINLNEPESPPNENIDPPVSRPSSLPLDNDLKLREKDLLKATTPTDSEGLSSIITSMSGHSKILNSLDEESQIKKKSVFKYKKNNFLLHENAVSNDPFDKVKNWQNSLPPLEQIETPETTLYNINNAYSSTDTNYKGISSPKIENEYVYSDESCPLSWREEPYVYKNNVSSQVINESEFYSDPSQNCVDEGEQFHEGSLPLKKEKSPSQSNIQSSCIIQRRQKRPPLLRCFSLPAYDHDSITSGNRKNEIYIPPLDLNTVTVSDDESYCQQDYYLIKSKAVASSSFSREDSVDRSIQTPQSFSSCKATISEERVPMQTISKSTSITPERSRVMDLAFGNRERPGCSMSTFGKKCTECNRDTTINRCHVCGESISGDKNGLFFSSRSNSCESVQKKDAHLKETPDRHSKPPFKRSVSFGSGTTTPRYCSHENPTSRDYFLGLNEESFENFDAYASNLKARSQVVIKALTAHVNNS